MVAPNSSISRNFEGRMFVSFVPAFMSGMENLMGLHRHLLDDEVRTGAFLRALDRVVQPGQVIADLGTGTGILAMAAARKGPEHVYAIESDLLVRRVSRVAAANGLRNDITFIEAPSENVELPRKVDVIVSECLGLAGLGGSMVGSVMDLRDRFLSDGGTVMPRTISAVVAPVESAVHHDYVHAWDRQPRYGFDLSGFQELANNNLYIGRFREADFLAAPQTLASVDLLQDASAKLRQLEATLRFQPKRDGTCHGYCAWFECELCDGVSLSSAPTAEPIVWAQVYLPLAKATRVSAAGTIEVDLAIHGDEHAGGQSFPAYFRWNTTLSTPGEPAVVWKQSTWKSYPWEPPISDESATR